MQKLKKLFLTLLNRPQLLILYELKTEEAPITRIIKKLQIKEKIPEATLRFNARKLLELGLITYGNKTNRGEIAKLTEIGWTLCNLLDNNLITQMKFIPRINGLK